MCIFYQFTPSWHDFMTLRLSTIWWDCILSILVPSWNQTVNIWKVQTSWLKKIHFISEHDLRLHEIYDSHRTTLTLERLVTFSWRPRWLQFLLETTLEWQHDDPESFSSAGFVLPQWLLQHVRQQLQLSLSDDALLSLSIRPELKMLFKCYLNSLFLQLEHRADNQKKVKRKWREEGGD